MNPRRMVATAPLSRSVNSRTIAPKMIPRIVTAIMTPLNEAAIAWTNGTFQNPRAKTSVIT